VVAHVTAERASGGEYTSVQDFVSRVPLPALNKRTIESLFKSGAFDRFGHTRRALIEVHEKVVDDATREKKDASKGVVGFDFGELFDQPVELIPDRPEWPRKTKLEFEREMLGLYVSDHPLNGQEVVLQRNRTLYVSDLVAVPKVAVSEGEETEWELQGASEDDVITLTGLLRNIEHRTARASGKQYASAVLEDMSGSIDLSILGNAYEDLRPLLVNDSLVAISGRVRLREQFLSVMVRNVKHLEVSLDSEVTIIRVQVPAEHSTATVIAELDDVLKRYPGDAEVELRLRHASGVQVFTLPHRVTVSGPLYGELKRVLGPNCFV